MKKWQLKAVDTCPINVFIEESAKDDFMELMRWDEKTFEEYTILIEN